MIVRIMILEGSSGFADGGGTASMRGVGKGGNRYEGTVNSSRTGYAGGIAKRT